MNEEFNGYRASILQDEKVLEIGYIHNNVNILNTTELYSRMVKMVKFMLCIFYHTFFQKVAINKIEKPDVSDYEGKWINSQEKCKVSGEYLRVCGKNQKTMRTQ